MDRRLKAHLYDINVAIDEIYSFFEQVPKRFDEYQKNLMLRRAIERNIGIIGEATGRIARESFSHLPHKRQSRKRLSLLFYLYKWLKIREFYTCLSGKSSTLFRSPTLL